ncbi:LysR family transcriptional regulator [Amycolatopsis sp. NPDC059021]|uniref:LysR family transcriptional regulator n=1 Tax=Amycolatopsis sp. NPDC059021 TaxID=3346704 RepID=UPI00366E1ECD
MNRMDLQVLRLFQAVARGATVTETAAQANVTQPALSRALDKIEREAGAELFQRVGRALRLTPVGTVFAGHVDALLEDYDRGLRAVQDMIDPEAGLVPLAFLHTLGTWLVPPLLSGFRDRFPKTRFELHQHGEEGLVRELLDGGVDLVLTSGDPGNPAIRWKRLLVEPLRLAVPPRHRLAGRRRIRLAEVADETFVLLRPGYGLRDTTERLCREAGFVPRVGFEGEEVETLRGLVTAGLGVSLLPLPQTATFPSSGTEPLAPHLTVTDVQSSRDIGLAWIADRALPPASAGFREHVLRSVDGAPAGPAAGRRP